MIRHTCKGSQGLQRKDAEGQAVGDQAGLRLFWKGSISTRSRHCSSTVKTDCRGRVWSASARQDPGHWEPTVDQAPHLRNL